MWVARASNALILGLGLVVMTQLSSIESAWRVPCCWAPEPAPLLVLRWLWWRISAWGEIACLAVSLAAAGPLLAGVHDEALRLLLMAVLATVSGVVVSVLTPEDPERLRAFFQRVQPPGWWGPVARAAGVDPGDGVRRLAAGGLGMLLTAASLFSLLTGLGTWLCRSPAPLWWPFRGRYGSPSSSGWDSPWRPCGCGGCSGPIPTVTPVWDRLDAVAAACRTRSPLVSPRSSSCC